MFRAMPRGPVEARVSVTVVAARVICYTEIRCPECNHRLLDVPGTPLLELQTIKEHATGTGPVIKCRHCTNMIEVIEL